MASYDKDLDCSQLCFGRSGETSAVGMWIVKYPFAASGASWESPDQSVGIHAGDWHWGADRYRNWLETWLTQPQVPKRIKELSGTGGSVWLKDRDEHLLNSYEDIIQRAEAAPPGCIIGLIGWMYNGHDTYYAEYVPIPDLGGAKALVSAVDRVHRSGRVMYGYMNARLAAVATQTYKNNGKRWAVLTKQPGIGVSSLSFSELHEGWNEEWSMAKRGEGWHAVMCPAVKGWQDHLVSEALRMITDYHFDGLFVDQPGSFYSELCYNKDHGHKTPASGWGSGYLEMLRRIREETRKVNPKSFLSIEGMNDAYGQYVDYHLDKNPLWEPMRIHPQMETFVEMWRYTLPMYVTVNDPGAYSYAPSKNWFYAPNYHFVLGIRTRGNTDEWHIRPTKVTADEASHHQAVVDKVERLWEKGKEILFYGRFRDDVGLRVSESGVLAKVYVADAGIAVPMWNATGEPISVDVAIDLRTLGRSDAQVTEVVSLDGDERIPFNMGGGAVRAQVKVPPNDIAVIAVRTKR